MTSRRFHYSFSPWKEAPTSRRTIELTTSQIAKAALREIAQLSLSALPFDSFLNSLLVPSDAWFKWVSPLGRVRETKTAFSGLFGRFVARAYLIRATSPSSSRAPNLAMREHHDWEMVEAKCSP